MIYVILGGSILQYAFSWLLRQQNIALSSFWGFLAINAFYLGVAVDLFLPAASPEEHCGMPAFFIILGMLIFGGSASLLVAFLHASLVQGAKEDEALDQE